ncbi:MAG: long-chain fatty acid--CoA ligase [Ginsengibacter sp.]
MKHPERLFDCIEYLLEKNPSLDLLAGKKEGGWKKYTVAETARIVNELSAGLLALGISANDGTPLGRDKISIISKNRPEWLMVDLAVQQIGAVLTPIYPTINLQELEFILGDAEVKVVFVNDVSLFHKVAGIKNRLPQLQHIFSFDYISGVSHWEEILDNNRDLMDEVKSISAGIVTEDLATIIYTSGTTGIPKGVMLSHRNIVSNVMASVPCLPSVDSMRALSFLPLNHILERMVSYLYLFAGTTIFYAESLETVGENLREVKPHFFTTVPYLLEKVYEKIMSTGNSLTGIKRKLFMWAHGLATRFEINRKLPLGYTIQLALANKIVFSKWREGLGNEVKAIVSGGAACQVRLIRIFTAARIIIMEGYGLSETSPVISVNRYDEKGRMFGTVGPLIDGVQVKIANDGEILCKGPNIMMGYYKHPELTAEVMEEGWFKTGDIGMMVDGDFLKITDRKKEMFKTSGGKYVSPLPIEGKLKESLLVENAIVIGAEQKYTGALIVPAFSNLVEWCKSNDIEYTSDSEMIKNKNVIALYKEIVENSNKGFNPVEQIKKFELLPHNWSVETGELTPKLSLKRKVILERHRDAVVRIYN